MNSSNPKVVDVRLEELRQILPNREKLFSFLKRKVLFKDFIIGFLFPLFHSFNFTICSECVNGEEESILDTLKTFYLVIMNFNRLF